MTFEFLFTFTLNCHGEMFDVRIFVYIHFKLSWEKKLATQKEKKMASVSTSVDEFLRIGCGCKIGPLGGQCIENFSKEEFVSCCDSFLELSKDEKDLFVLSFLTLTGKRKCDDRYSHFTIYGEKTCKTTFLYLLNMSRHKFQNIAEHYLSNGLTSRVHGKKGSLPLNNTSKTLSFRTPKITLCHFLDVFLDTETSQFF